ncbi:hypothetical protein LY78DRAFT_377620 [Colletotrichum sublineola]|nr:hypothetical protein LY78DRAFT_377620 [Colletotrichum sublineola]
MMDSRARVCVWCGGGLSFVFSSLHHSPSLCASLSCRVSPSLLWKAAVGVGLSDEVGPTTYLRHPRTGSGFFPLLLSCLPPLVTTDPITRTTFQGSSRAICTCS